MDYKLRTYPGRGMSAPFVVLMMVSCLSFSVAQEQACPIRVTEEITDQQIARRPQSIHNISIEDQIDWVNQDHALIVDDEHTTAVLPPHSKSATLSFDNFGMHIPPGSIIKGIKVSIEGMSASGYDYEVLLKLKNHNGPKGMSLANFPLYGDNWPEGNDGLWNYGDTWYLWGVNWTHEELNDSDFGFVLQVGNNSDETQSFSIDHVNIEITYHPLFTVCDHKCVVFHVDPIEDALSYNWTVPEGWEVITAESHDDIISIRLAEGENGFHTICVVTETPAGLSNQCCRTFLLKECAPVSIGDYVWFDKDGDGLQDATESGIPYMEVVLHDYEGNVISIDTTDSEGVYLFVAEEGDYYLSVNSGDGHIETLHSQGDGFNDSDLTGENGHLTTGSFYMSEGEQRDDLDLGLTQRGSIISQVWEDSNHNGLQDADETGMLFSAYIMTCTGQFMMMISSDENGELIFDDLLPGCYQIQYILPTNTEATIINPTDDALNSDIDSTGLTVEIILCAGQIEENIDAGYFMRGRLGDFVWIDTDYNGIQDPGEPGYGGLFIKLLNEMGNAIDSTTSLSTGYYEFNSLSPGIYSIEIVVPDNHIVTLNDVGDDLMDSDIIECNPGVFCVTNIVIISGEFNDAIDIGLVEYSSISGEVWIDEDMNGTQASTEGFLENVEVSLFSEGGVLVSSTLSDDMGSYFFEMLLPGVYYLVFDKDDIYNFTTPNIGSTDMDSDITGAVTVGSTSLLSITSGSQLSQIDCGLIDIRGGISGEVWIDDNNDGLQDIIELSHSDIAVSLHDETGTLLASTTTDDLGEYSFNLLMPGSYYVEFEINEVYDFTLPNAGTDDIDSDVTGSNGIGTTNLIVLGVAEYKNNVDAGLIDITSEISGNVWIDKNADGIHDSSEISEAGIIVTLTEGTVIQTDTTDENGNYFFDHVLMGAYLIVFNVDESYSFSEPYQGSADIDSDVIDPSGTTDFIVIDPSIQISNIDAGIYQRGSISGFVWSDDNKNGNIDNDESSFPGVEVNLLDDAGLIEQTVVSDEEGNYIFIDVTPGQYSVSFLAPTPYEFAIDDTSNVLDTDIIEIDGDSGYSDTVMICSGDMIIGIDAGLILNDETRITGIVWEDLNADGTRMGEEPRMEGIGVILFDDLGAPITSTMTDINGFYSFDGINPGDYRLVVMLIGDQQLSPSNVGGDDGIDSDYEMGCSCVDVTVLAFTPVTNVDAGIYLPGSISGQIWEDIDCDGLRDMDEPIIKGVAVILKDTMDVIKDMQSPDGSGHYSFVDVVPGLYHVEFMGNSHYTFTEFHVGADDTIDSDVEISVGSTGKTMLFSINSGQAITSVDAGFKFKNRAEITGTVWFDENCNGLMDSNEDSYQGILLKLIDANTGVVLDSLISQPDGNYSFDSLEAGSYYIDATLVDLTYFTEAFVGADSLYDSDIFFFDQVSGMTLNLILSEGQIFEGVNVGIKEIIVSSLGGLVWCDLNEDGIYNEPPTSVLEGIVVNLLDGEMNFIISTVTDALGMYSFDQLLPEEFFIEFELPADKVFTESNQGGDDDLDSDVMTFDVSSGKTEIIFVPSTGADISNIFAGMKPIPFSSICGQVWNDENCDGLLDGIESGFPGIEITLLDGFGAAIDSFISDQTGLYKFDSLPAGEYTILATLLDLTEFTTPHIGGDPLIDSDIVNSNQGIGNTDIISLFIGENKEGVNVGIKEIIVYSLGGLVWCDLNEDGIYNESDTTLLEGIVVNLLDGDMNILTSTVTDDLGKYSFSQLLPEDFFIEFELPDDKMFSDPNQGGDDDLDSDVVTFDGDSGKTGIIFIPSTGIDVSNIYAGMKPLPLSSICGIVWEDLDCNGVNDISEIGMEGISVLLLGESGNVKETTVTDDQGKYCFQDLSPGTYNVNVELPQGHLFTQANVGSDDADSDITMDMGQSGMTDPIELGSGIDMNHVDAGLKLMPSMIDIDGVVWEDLNADGIRQTSEPGTIGITVRLKDDTGAQIAETMTGANGDYSFSSSPPDTYYIEIVYEKGEISSLPNQGGDDSVDSDITDTHGPNTTDLISVTTSNVDAGYYLMSTIGDYVWGDQNLDHVQNGFEIGINGIDVDLYDASMTLLQSTVSTFNPLDNSRGYYQFDVVPGDYYIDVSNPFFADPDVGTDDLDSDITHAFGFGTSDIFSVSSGQSKDDVDAGLIQDPGSIGDYVWLDNDENGVQDVEEVGLNDVLVRLKTWTGVQVAQMITIYDSDGNAGFYRFDNLQPGAYYVVFDTPPNHVPTLPDQGGNDTKDSDVSGAIEPGSTMIFTLGAGEDDMDLDAGYFTSSITPLVVLKGENSVLSNDLVWTIDFELDVERLTLERSREGSTYNKLTDCSLISNQDNYEDYELFGQSMYAYRMKAELTDGSVLYSNEVQLNADISSPYVVDILPNPVGDEMNVRVTTQSETGMSWSIYDLNGRLLDRGSLDYILETGESNILIYLNVLLPGQYLVQFDFKHRLVTKRIVKM